jgi:serine/threonine protein kinase
VSDDEIKPGDPGDAFTEGPTLPIETQAPTAARTIDFGESVAGAVIGSYRLLELVGEGGMGEVWLAEQKVPVLRRVALKLVKPGIDTREVVARFQSERQALALMDHPAIAKVFDAGSTPHHSSFLPPPASSDHMLASARPSSFGNAGADFVSVKLFPMFVERSTFMPKNGLQLEAYRRGVPRASIIVE